MSDTNPVSVWLPALRQAIPVPAELQAEAQALDKADFQPGDGVISQTDTMAEMQPQLRRIAEASLKAFDETVLKEVDRATADPTLVKSLTDKAKLAAVAKGELPQVNQQLEGNFRLRGIQTASNGADGKSPVLYTVRLANDAANDNTNRYRGRDNVELTLTPDDTAASFNLKTMLALARFPRAAQDFMARHGGESSPDLLVPLRKILFTQGFSASTLGLGKERNDDASPVLDAVTYDAARDRLIVSSRLSTSYPGTMELQVLDTGSTKTVVASWKSLDGTSERVMGFDRRSGQWNAISSSGVTVQPPQIYY